MKLYQFSPLSPINRTYQTDVLRILPTPEWHNGDGRSKKKLRAMGGTYIYGKIRIKSENKVMEREAHSR